jgi:2-polyprenyl-3-methyl-5-hydroxy-6-metoxy-1,4-benzoquinol methylase
LRGVGGGYETGAGVGLTLCLKFSFISFNSHLINNSISKKMEDTGERHILKTEFFDCADYYGHLLHIASYQFGLQYVSGKKVLDYGCGSGYGTHILSKTAQSVVGVDVSNETVLYAKENFASDNLIFKNINELTDEKFDVIISFQVIEHVQNGKTFLKKLKGMLNSGGILLLTTPDKHNRLFNYIQKPWNKYHLKEYSEKNMENLIKQFFVDFEILKISSVAELVLPEIKRRKKQRIITIPATLFFYPNFLRIFLLDFQVWLYEKVSTILKKKNKQIMSDNTKPSFLKYTVEDIIISKDIEFSTDLLVVCRNV